MRRVIESATVLHQVAAATDQPMERVEKVVSALRDAIDALFLDGYTIFIPPLTLTYKTDPVAPLFAERWEDASDAERSAWFSGDLEATAEWLGVTLVEYLRHPVASELHVLMALFDGLGIEDADRPEGIEIASIASAWFDTFAAERRYRLSTVGLERDLEAWLIHHTERLVEIGYDVRLRQQQFVLPDRRRPDLVFDLLQDDGSAGTLIVELKATGGYLGAVDQLIGYMGAFVSLGLAGGALRGLLIADGIPPDVMAYADERGIDTATLAELGYRRDLAVIVASASSPPDRYQPPTAEETDIIDMESSGAAEPAYFLAWGESVYQAHNRESASDPVPFLRLTARSLSDPVNDVEPVGTPGWEYTSAREHLTDDVLTPGQLGVRFGSSCCLLPANAAAEEEMAAQAAARNDRIKRSKVNAARAGRRVKLRATNDPAPAAEAAAVTRIFTMFHGMDSDQTQPLATLRFGADGMCEWVSDDQPFATFAPGHIYSLTLDEMASTMSSCVFVPVDGETSKSP